MTRITPTSLWNDSSSLSELAYSIEHGAVGATCNPVIMVGTLKKESMNGRVASSFLLRSGHTPRKTKSRGSCCVK